MNLDIIQLPQLLSFINETYSHFNKNHKGYNIDRIIS